MKNVAVLASMVALLCATTLARAADDGAYDNALAAFRGAGESGVYFDRAYGYALFPTIGKGGIGVGGARGKGRVYRQGEYVGNSTMTQLTLGFQLGGQKFTYTPL